MTSTAFLALGLALLSLTSAATVAFDPVLDVDGNELQVGVPYQIWGIGIGAGPVSIANSTGGDPCPQNVVQVPFGAPPFPPVVSVTFWPAKSSETVVRVNRDLNIVFNLLTDCPSNVWMVHPYDESSEQFFITTGGKFGNPGCGTINNWFQFAAVEGTSHYKLIADPHVCDVHSTPTDVTVVGQGEQSRLYLNVEHDPDKFPFEIRFVKDSGDLVRSDH